METIIGKQFPNKVIPLIDNSKSSIKIVVFDWRWYPLDPSNPVQLFNQALLRAHRRGVKVSVIANSQDIITLLQREGIDAKKPASPSLIHSKLIIVDDSVLVIGSHNFTQNAFTMNHEVSVIVDDAGVVRDCLEYFNNLKNNYG